jgi:serine/threonine-protein kinase
MSDPQLDETMPLPQGGGATPTDTAPATPAAGTSATQPAAQSVDFVGRQLGDFRVLRRLGSGGMAEVFLAEQVSLKRQVALKILKPELVQESDDSHLKRFTQEATAAANLNHPHIVQVYAIGEHKGTHYIAQEYVPGLTLREWLRKNGPPEPLIAIRILRQVALALQAAAEAGVVHRDIKPENVLLTKKGEAKVADFGLAQLSQTSDRVQLTQIGMTMGTPLYMSPEQVEGKPLDHRSDLYSLGVTAYHLLAGTPPFRGETAVSVAVQHLNVTAEPLHKVRPDLPVALCELVEKMMDKRPGHRYQTAAELAEDLRALGVALKVDPQAAAKKNLGDFTVAKEAPAPPMPLALSDFFDWTPRRHAVTLAAAAAVVLLLAAGIGWATRPADPLRAPLPRPTIERAKTAWDQVFMATIDGTDEAWQAVLDFWPASQPENDRPRSQAALRLGLLRLADRDRAGAAQLFRELAASPSNEWAQVNGNAGLAVLAAIENRRDDLRQAVTQLSRIGFFDVGRQLDSEMGELFRGVGERPRTNDEAQRSLNQLLEQIAAEGPEDGPGNGPLGPPPGPPPGRNGGP